MLHNIRFLLSAWIVVVALIFLCSISPAFTASFYGDSYLKVPLQDARSRTDLYFKFKTHKPNALLFLAAGSIDYCLLMLESGVIKIRINLGAGEAVLYSTAGVRLDDMLWHDVELHRTDAELVLTVDNLHTTYLDIPGRFFELNIKYGIFVGGLGDFSELFLGNIPNFRGCIDDVIFNNDYDVLKIAAESTDTRNVFLVTWDCSDEFDADSQLPISFMERGSYVAFPTWSDRNGGTVAFDIKTQIHTAVLFYNTGVPSKTDFIALEILQGKLSMSVNEGNGVVVLQSDVSISDGLWHHVETQFSPSFIEIDIDGHVKNLRPGLGENRFFDLSGYFYVGGIGLSQQSRALQSGLQSIMSEGVESSVKGCLKDLKVNQKVLGLREAEVTHNIQPDCLWEYPCLQNPCIPEAECYQDGVDNFRCMCEYDVCVRANFTSGYKLYTKSSLPIDLEVLALHPLDIAEGGSELITRDHIKVVLDYQQYGLRESNVLFHIIEAPKHGTLEIELWRSIADNIFTLMDINTDKVRYTHDGSESRIDAAVFELEFRSSNFRLPDYLEKRHRFVFHIQISPVNDPPKLKLPPGKTLRLAKYTKKPLTRDFLEAEDPDNQPSELVYTVLPHGTGENEGYVENANNPGKPVSSFTQEDIDNGLIMYVHRGAASGRLAFRVSDFKDSSQTGFMKITTFDLVISLVNNTGIILPYDSYALITSDNLTFTDNSPDQELDIRYDVTTPPQYGSIQRLRNNGKWHTVNHFTQRQLRKQKIRYLHVSGRPTKDEFKFAISCMEVKAPTIYDFHITFIAINLREVNRNVLTLEKKLDGHITEAELKFESFPIATSADQIRYVLATVPSFGNLIRFFSSGSDQRHTKLEVNDQFSQHDINSKRIKYKIHRKSYSVVQDNFTFYVQCPGGVKSENFDFKITHIPGENDAIIINEKITVLEGGEATIGPSELHLEIPGIRNISFNVTVPPKHGKLQKIGSSSSDQADEMHFSSDDVANNRLVYVHDDSENEKDFFHFVASDSSDGLVDFIYYGTVHINVIMKNDNPPIRVVDKVFHVVVDGERKLTSKDLKYVDADIDSKKGDVVYSTRGFPNGKLFRVDDPNTEVTEFTQVDLDNCKLVFRHNGASYGEGILRITDGKFFATGILEIQASKPYIKISKNTGLVVKRGENGILTSANLSVDTNLNADSDQITYKITSFPKYGEILLNGKPITEFTQKDLDLENIEYENDNSISFRDYLRFSAYLEDISVESVFEFRIYPEVYWDPLRVMQNKSLHVDEDVIATIDSSSLSIAQVSISPANITYVITIPPAYGFLALGNPKDLTKFSPEAHSVMSFTQKSLDDRSLHYIQTKKNITEDSFTFDVTNGITTLRNLKYKLHIVSKIIFLKTTNITVVEGHDVTLKSSEILVTNPYYSEWITEYLVVEKPRHGYISNANFPGSRLSKFLAAHLKSGDILYVHDGSETFRDWFTLVAKATALGKESSPSTVHVIVEPVNDEPPELIRNTGLDVWEGDITTITREHLEATDEDSDPEDLFFVISSLSSGYVAFANNTRAPILGFTQEQINRNFVVFVHTGDKTGGFRVQVNDGVNYDSPHVFSVTAKVLQIIVLTNEKLNILPRMQQSITKDHLYVTTNDNDFTRVIEFKVVKGPTLGRLLIEKTDGSLTHINKFTQEQINNNLLLYEHTKPMKGLSATDRIILDVETQHARPIPGLEFIVQVNVGNFGAGNLDPLVNLHPMELKEGGVSFLGQDHVDLSQLLSLWQGKGKSEFAKKLRIVLQRLPAHGWVEVDGVNITLTRNISFGREDIRKKRVRYHHDDSETTSDSFTMGFYIADGNGNPDVLLFNGSINITITPVNDNPFKVLTKTSVLNVVQGQSAVITPEILSVSDEDGMPQDILYEVMIPPRTGKIVSGGNSSNVVVNFTQEDINNHLVEFVHDGTRENMTSCHFKVSDGKHKSDYAVLNIYIVPLTLKLVNNSVIELQQGSTAVFLSNKHLGAYTNGNNEDIHYNITDPPSYGHIFLRDAKTLSFSQNDIDHDFVLYIQSDLSVSEDFFTVTVHSPDNIISDQRVNISVSPLVIQKPLNVSISSHAFINLEVLNASKLADITGGNPVYTVTKHPEYGSLIMINDTIVKRETHTTFIFTHDEVARNMVVYDVPELLIEHSVTDSFSYLLTAPRVQPATGSFVINLIPETTNNATATTVTERLPGKVPPAPIAPDLPVTDPTGTSEPGTFQPSIMGNDYMLIIGIVVGVVLVSVLIVVTIKCRAVRRKAKKSSGLHGNVLCSKERKIQGSHTTQSDLDVSDHIPSNGSLSFTEELPPPPPPPTSPSSTSSRTGCMGSSGNGAGGGGGAKTRTLKNRKTFDTDPTLPPPPYILENGEWTEVATSSVPTCKVTPLSHGGEPGEHNETTLKAPYFLRDRCEGEDWSNYDCSELTYGPPANPVLRKNQYWV